MLTRSASVWFLMKKLKLKCNSQQSMIRVNTLTLFSKRELLLAFPSYSSELKKAEIIVSILENEGLLMNEVEK